jgi:hypothetical protein
MVNGNLSSIANRAPNAMAANEAANPIAQLTDVLDGSPFVISAILPNCVYTTAGWHIKFDNRQEDSWL